MKIQTLYTVELTGSGQNFYTLYRHYFNPIAQVASHIFLQNLSVDFEEAVAKARRISGPDEDSEDYSKQLITSEGEARAIIKLWNCKAVAEENGLFTFGKYKGLKIEDIFTTDQKYVEWVAKGGFIKVTEPSYWEDRRYFEPYWKETVEVDRPIRQHAIALLIGAGLWIERNGKFMPVEKAERLDWLDSLTPNTSITEGQRVKGLTVQILKVYFQENDWGGKYVFKMIDEKGHLYNGSASGDVITPKMNDAWVTIDFTASWYNGKLYAKRIKVKAAPMDVEEFEQLLRLNENKYLVTHNTTREDLLKSWTKKDQQEYEMLQRIEQIRIEAKKQVIN